MPSVPRESLVTLTLSHSAGCLQCNYISPWRTARLTGASQTSCLPLQSGAIEGHSQLLSGGEHQQQRPVVCGPRIVKAPPSQQRSLSQPPQRQQQHQTAAANDRAVLGSSLFSPSRQHSALQQPQQAAVTRRPHAKRSTSKRAVSWMNWANGVSACGTTGCANINGTKFLAALGRRPRGFRRAKRRLWR